MNEKTQKQDTEKQTEKRSLTRSKNTEEADPPSSAAKVNAKQKKTAAKQGKHHILHGFLGFIKHKKKQNPRKKQELIIQVPGWTAQEKQMLANIAKLHAARVKDIMIPRSDIEALDLEVSLAEALRLFEQSGRSRMPVYNETLDDPRGMIHIRDLLNYITRSTLVGDSAAIEGTKNAFAALDLNMPISKLGIVRDVLFVPDSMHAGRLLTRMQAGRTQMALVIDEHSGTDGLVSMEDIVELIVGDIEDEHDESTEDIIKETQNSWVLDAATELEELKEHLGIDFADAVLKQDIDTIGGLLVTALGRIPGRGEKLEIFSHYQFQILEADRRRIKRVRLMRLENIDENQN